MPTPFIHTIFVLYYTIPHDLIDIQGICIISLTPFSVWTLADRSVVLWRPHNFQWRHTCISPWVAGRWVGIQAWLYSIHVPLWRSFSIQQHCSYGHSRCHRGIQKKSRAPQGAGFEFSKNSGVLGLRFNRLVVRNMLCCAFVEMVHLLLFHWSSWSMWSEFDLSLYLVSSFILITILLNALMHGLLICTHFTSLQMYFTSEENDGKITVWLKPEFNAKPADDVIFRNTSKFHNFLRLTRVIKSLHGKCGCIELSYMTTFYSTLLHSFR